MRRTKRWVSVLVAASCLAAPVAMADDDEDYGDLSTGGAYVPMSGTLSSIFYTPEEKEYSSDFRGSAGHGGIDIAAPQGDEIYAAFSGKVVEAGEAGGYGQWVVIQSEENSDIYSTYGHIIKYHVKKGDEVKAGDHIADNGSLGKSTGPHLHFQVDKGGYGLSDHAVDPLQWMAENGIDVETDRHKATGIELTAGAGDGSSSDSGGDNSDDSSESNSGSSGSSGGDGGSSSSGSTQPSKSSNSSKSTKKTKKKKKKVVEQKEPESGWVL